MEFKVHDPEKEETLAETVDKALRQIDEKQYDAEFLVYIKAVFFCKPVSSK